MKIIDPNYLMNTIPISQSCPKDIEFLVRWLKGMILWNDADLEKDKEVIINFLFGWANKSSPQHGLWNMKINREEVVELYNRAKGWIRIVEKNG